MSTRRPLPPVQQPQPCAVCAKRSSHECSHVACPNRRRVTAQPPDELEATGREAGGTYRVPPRTRD